MRYQIHPKIILGKELSKSETYNIVGAGISGLMAGFYLIYEKTDSPGGLIKTHKVPGFGIAEQAANGFIFSEELQEITEELGMEILAPNQESKARYLVRDLKLRKFPLTFFETVSMIFKALFPKKEKPETVEDFGRIFFGEAFTRQLLEPGFAGIYGADIVDLSFKGVLTPLAEEFNHTNSLIKVVRNLRKKAKGTKKKASGTHGFLEGLGELPLALADYLKDEIEYGVDGRDIVQSGEPTILTVPAYHASRMFSGEISSGLAKVTYTPVVSTTLFFNKAQLPGFKEGFGCLIPRSEGIKILGVLFNSCIFKGRAIDDEVLSLTCIFRDDTNEWMGESETGILEKVIMPDLSKLFGVQGMPLAFRMFKWEKGIPLYNSFLANAWSEWDSILQSSNTRLLGNYTGEISVRGMAKGIKRDMANIR